MKRGTYAGHGINYAAYSVPFFNPYVYFYHQDGGCGSSALSLLTGVDQVLIKRQNKNDRNFRDKFMISFLKKKGFQVIPITMCSVSHGGSTDVVSDNVILMSQLLKPNEGSWIVTYREKTWHNFDCYELSPLSLVNRPLLSAYVIWHKKWTELPKK